MEIDRNPVAKAAKAGGGFGPRFAIYHLPGDRMARPKSMVHPELE
jgi:hypothetical protein